MFGYLTSVAMRVTERDRRAVMIEGGMQNSGLALGIIAVQFNSDLGMVMIASLWGMWHIVSGLRWHFYWRRKDATTCSLKAARWSTAPAPRRCTGRRRACATAASRQVGAGRLAGSRRETVDAHGAWVTPGFVDIHTHYDGQATWDDALSPSVAPRRHHAS